MALTVEEVKIRYYQTVLEKGNAIYASWGKHGTTSKQIVAKANDYAFDKRLKTDEVFRFHTLAFAYALGMRLEKRYSTFWCKLFRLFAFLREREALKILKRVLGFSSNTDLQEMIDAESEKLFDRLSNRTDKDSKSGGKRAGKGELSVEEELENFLEECTEEEKEVDKAADKDEDKELSSDKTETAEKKGEEASKETEDKDREKISVEESKDPSKEGEEKKEDGKQIKTEEREKTETTEKEGDSFDSPKEEKAEEKSAANTSILAEKMIAEQAKENEPLSPFPVFREKDGIEFGGKEDAAPSGESEAKGKADSVNGSARTEGEIGKTPFPVFHGEKVGGVNGNEKPIEKLADKMDESLADKLDVKDIATTKEKNSGKQMEISEENKARIALNTTMSEKQIRRIAEKLMRDAEAQMERETQAWREKISVEEGPHVDKGPSQPVANQQTTVKVVPPPKK